MANLDKLVEGYNKAEEAWSESSFKITENEIEQYELNKYKEEIIMFFNPEKKESHENIENFLLLLYEAVFKYSYSKIDNIFNFLYWDNGKQKIWEILESLDDSKKESLRENLNNIIIDEIESHMFNNSSKGDIKELKVNYKDLIKKARLLYAQLLEKDIYESTIRVPKFRMNFGKEYIKEEEVLFYLDMNPKRLEALVKNVSSLSEEKFLPDILPPYAKEHSLKDIQKFLALFGDSIMSAYEGYSEISCGIMTQYLVLLARKCWIDIYTGYSNWDYSHVFWVVKIKDQSGNAREYRIDMTVSQFVFKDTGIAIFPRIKSISKKMHWLYGDSDSNITETLIIPKESSLVWLINILKKL